MREWNKPPIPDNREALVIWEGFMTISSVWQTRRKVLCFEGWLEIEKGELTYWMDMPDWPEEAKA